MRRLYMLLPGVESCRVLVDDLEGMGIPTGHLHVVGSLEQDLGQLPRATVWQKSELLHGLEIGVGMGAMAGVLAWLLGRLFPPLGMEINNMVLGWSVVAGALFGGIVSALMKQHEHNHRLTRYHQAVAAGQILLMVDVPRSKVKRTRERILSQHPEVRIDGVRKKKR